MQPKTASRRIKAGVRAPTAWIRAMTITASLTASPVQRSMELPHSSRSISRRPADYAVYASRPEVKGLSDSVPVGGETTSGLQWTKVNQQQDGGRWVRIGTIEMAPATTTPSGSHRRRAAKATWPPTQ
jgi:hypothetical protein